MMNRRKTTRENECEDTRHLRPEIKNQYLLPEDPFKMTIQRPFFHENPTFAAATPLHVDVYFPVDGLGTCHTGRDTP